MAVGDGCGAEGGARGSTGTVVETGGTGTGRVTSEALSEILEIAGSSKQIEGDAVVNAGAVGNVSMLPVTAKVCFLETGVRRILEPRV